MSLRGLPALVRYTFILVREVVLASIGVTKLVFGPVEKLRSGFVAYAPPGSIARGAVLAKTGGAVVQNGRTMMGPTMECFTCHGQKLEGTLLGPPIAALVRCSDP